MSAELGEPGRWLLELGEDRSALVGPEGDGGEFPVEPVADDGGGAERVGAAFGDQACD